MSLAGKEWTHLHIAVTPFLCELRSYKDTSFSAYGRIMEHFYFNVSFFVISLFDRGGHKTGELEN